MATTIQVQEDTLAFLKHLREVFQLPSYDALVRVLVQKIMIPQESLWGKAGKMDMKTILKDLRDEGDRY